MNRKLIYVGLLIVALVLIITDMSSCTSENVSHSSDKIISVKTETVTLVNSYDGSNYVGTVEAATSFSLSFAIPGTVERVLVDDGDKVKTGQLLAVVDKATLQSTYDAALSTLEMAKDAKDRLQKLHDNGSLPEMQWVEVQSKLQQAVSAEQIAAKSLKNTELKAPASGIVASKNIEAGMNILPGVSVMQILDINKVYVTIPIPENEISNIQVGSDVTITIYALDNKTVSGKITSKGVTANPITHTYEAKILITNVDNDLMPGMVCNAVINSKKQESKMIVPNKAIQLGFSGEHFVWLYNNGIAKQQVIDIDGLSGNGVIVVNGLKEGDKVIVEGNQKISEGMKIKEL